MATYEPARKAADQDHFQPTSEEGTPLSIAEVWAALRGNALLLTLGPLAAGALAFGVASLIPPTFTASTTFMPPQQSQSAAASALASLGSLATLAGGAGVRSSADQYVALMQSATISDRLIDQFKLMEAYDVEFRVDARGELNSRTRFAVGKKDGLISVQVDDTSPKRASEIANRYVEELRLVTDKIAVTEAQQRRAFFERHLIQSRDQLALAQKALQASGFNAGALKAEPKAAADAYAKLKAEVVATEIKLSALRSSLSEATPEVQQQLATLSALRGQLSKTEQATGTPSSLGPDYLDKYRDFKYQETLFEMYARQFELARIDEGREGGLIQVIDSATPPEKKSKPRRGFIALGGSAAALAALLIFVLMRQAARQETPRP